MICTNCVYLAKYSNQYGDERWCARWAMNVIDATRKGAVSCSERKGRGE